jgi:hypothetical protein
MLTLLGALITTRALSDDFTDYQINFLKLSILIYELKVKRLVWFSGEC